jgi:hypothetical protein
MAKRLTRNQIIQHALDMVDSAELDNHDRPGKGPVVGQAYTLRWLQDALDYFSHIFPWAYDVATQAVTITGATFATPDDFILDVRNGLVLTLNNGGMRLYKRSVQDIINASLSTGTNKPQIYAVMDDVIRVAPTPDQAYSATLWYYALPDVMGGCEYPKFPSDWILIEYLRLRALEWLRALPPGSAMDYAEKMVAKLQRAGFDNEPEYQEIQWDNKFMTPSQPADRSSWMGSVF